MEHPIHNLLKISMENIKEMIDVNTIVGNAVQGENGQLIIPVSKVKFGFASGGTELKTNNKAPDSKAPFGGGTGGTVSITPTAFLVINKDDVNVLTLNQQAHLYEKLIDKVPETLGKLKRKKQELNVT